MKTRLDAELVRRGLVRSREVAAELISNKLVLVSGIPATKAATQVDAQTSITLKDEGEKFVSRGGFKLNGALDHFSKIDVSEKTVLDAGASTGGFTDVLLRRGAKKVFAVDVGYGQLAWDLQTNPKVKVLDRVNVRSISPQIIDEPVDLVVADLSFISLKLVLPSLISVAKSEADYLLMVKPQFEVGKENLGAGGVVRENALRKLAVLEVANVAFSLSLGCLGVVASELPGPSGNVEYFLWLKQNAPAILEVDLDHAIFAGPQ
jgi:23S rRNA (cytidine1920-2'-O)/16S rRNA (cytidine1409-2'-O)-methyltransferase